MRRNTVIGAKIEPEKKERARALRREMTPAEIRLWDRLRRNGLGGWHFRRQQVIRGFIVDFYCHAAGAVVELDGSSHAGREESDAERDRILAEEGLRVMRIRNADVMDHLQDALDRILRFCETR